MLEKHTVVIEQRKTRWGWRRNQTGHIIYTPSHNHAVVAANHLNTTRSMRMMEKERYVIISIEKV